MIMLINTTWDKRELVLFQSILKAYPTSHSWMIKAHVSLGNMGKQWKLFTKQMIRTHQLLPSFLWKPEAPTQLLSGLDEEFSNLNSIYTSYQPPIQAATQLLQREPSFDGIPISSKYMKRSLLPFLGDVLSWLPGTATTKNINAIKSRINQLISHTPEPARDPCSWDVNTQCHPSKQTTYQHCQSALKTLYISTDIYAPMS